VRRGREVAVGRLTAPCGGCLGDRRVDGDLLPAHLGSGELKGCGSGTGLGKGRVKGRPALMAVMGRRGTVPRRLWPVVSMKVTDPSTRSNTDTSPGPPANNSATRGFGSEKLQRRSRGAATVLLWVAWEKPSMRVG